MELFRQDVWPLISVAVCLFWFKFRLLRMESAMGQLVRFDKKKRFKSTQSTRKGDGEIILFTGVRYERAPEGLSEKKHVPIKRKRTRR